MKKGKKILATVLMMACMSVMLIGCGTSSDGAAAAGSNTLVMATNAAFHPYEYVENGEYVGIDVEIAQAIAKELGMELEIKDVEFGSIIAGVESGKAAIIANVEPVVAALLGIVLFHEKLSVWVGLGIICVLSGVILLAKEDEHGEA